MKTFLLLDALQRKINSLLFRLTIIVYSVLIIYIFDDYFNFWTYFIALILYIFVYIKCFNNSFLRLLNDFALISIVLWKRDPENIYIFTYLMLPIVNSINFSGDKKVPILLYSLSFGCFQLLYYQFHAKLPDNIMLVLLPIAGLYAINSYTNLRVKVQVYKEELAEVVDSFYIQKQYLKRPHKIYKELINTLNRIFRDEVVDNMYCFSIVNERIVLVNGTKFIWNFSIKTDIIEEIREKKHLYNVDVDIEGQNSIINLMMYSKIGQYEYIYFFDLKKNIPFYYSLIDFFNTILPTLNKISKILISEKEMQSIRNEEIKALSDKRQYVNRANNMMHFIRNRLSPFANLIAMFDRLSTVPENKLEEYKTKLNEQNNRAKVELKNITDRADDMLEKSKNPFFYSMLEDVTLIRAFTLLKKSYTNIFPDYTPIPNIDPLHSKWTVKINQEGYEIFISDWLNNIKKYYNNYVNCNFTEDGDYLYILFENDHTQTKEVISSLINDLTSNDRNEIMKRTTHGLHQIKSVLNDMDINFNVYEKNGILRLVLKLKISQNESSNI